ncbi:MAG: hypothetical protein K0S39_3833 [Paenibacillus sp.]|jgi:hypothetical protein|nr:hypothetical protein [Paenibacillus sp.]
MIPLYFEKLSMYERSEEPCTVAVPFAEGALKPGDGISVFDGTRPVPTQTGITSKWNDGSVKWLLVNFLADLPANASKQFHLRTNAETVKPAELVQINDRNGSLVIDTGAVQVELTAAGETGLFRSVHSKGQSFYVNRFYGPSIQNEDNQTFAAQISEKGWSVVESGPVRSIVQARGKHAASDGKEWMDFTVRIYAYAGKPWLRVDYQIIHRELQTAQKVHALELRIGRNKDNGDSNCSESEQVRLGLAKSNYKTEIDRGAAGDRLSHRISAEDMKYEANEHIPETFYGTYWADLSEQNQGGVCVTLYQAQQNFPKSFDVSANEIIVGIIPEGDHVEFLQGMAKTHRMFLHFHKPGDGFQEVNIRSHQFQLPDRPVLETATYEQAGVLEPMLVDRKLDWVERAFITMADTRPCTYGILHWGDAPDQGYTEQGRGNGDWIWSNNEYDFPHAAIHLYARTGTRRFLDYVLTAAEHWLDVDICHFSEDPLKFQGHIMHSVRHATLMPKVCHQWVEGLLDYYHMTGEKSALEAALGVGANVTRILSTPRYKEEGGINARESGWALRSLGALYKETGDPRWLESADRIVDHFEAWKAKYGAWLSPYTDHSVVRVPFMISVAANSLMRYYLINPQERIKQMIVDAMEDLLEHSYNYETGVFYYKELPSLQRLGTNPIILEPLAYAYEFTGNDKFLKAGKVTFRQGLEKIGMNGGGGAKQISGDAVIWWRGTQPKQFPQYYYPMFYYYRTAMKAGILV